MTKVVLGGGLAGLSASYYLLNKLPNQHITLIESSNRLGGWLKSNVLNGVIFEEGPRTIRPHGIKGINTLALIENLGLSHQVIPILSSHPAAKNRMIYANGQLCSLPSNISSIFKTKPPFSKPLIRHLMQDLFAPRKIVKDESIYDFVSRRFGKEVSDYLISALVCGVCAGNAKEISVNFLMKQLFEYEQTYGSISKGIISNIFTKKQDIQLNRLALRAKKEKWNVYSFENGIETLTKSLEDFNKRNNVSIELNSKCNDLEISGNNVIIHCENGKHLTADHVVSSISSENLAYIIQKQHPHLSDMLHKIKSVTVGVVNLQYDKKLIKKDGFGFLVPPKEKLPILGVIFDTCCFPKADNTVLTVMMGGYWFEELFGKHPHESVLLQIAKEQLKSILQISEEPIQYKVNILEKCIPQYVVGHDENVIKIRDYLNKNKLPLTLCGASYDGVGVNDVILSAKNAVETSFN